ncbi:uncharacterized protein BT62DRAFT_469141 [Guyanagaster necrorhizus]|uniref:C2H2-type domain-containing protein n=1 Tax=Guyanagaster necrorhizus TaxID=856835 RepID=A0A9P8APA8_9AGAR|nr:uncharacterized protein BT62DRAFT_469141 [Guyanagaster necrorhizus MCA 3950]KAG7441667.1 hypothetical protein BT62DRAFT_469141 [Guyanagaster necrorhizus MCA 3950]
MARLQAKHPQIYACTYSGCRVKMTRKHDVQRHEKTHLTGEPLTTQKFPCLSTESGCPFSSLQLSNLKAHIRAKHPEVEHLMCFDCRPMYRRFSAAAKLAEHRRVEHRLTKTQNRYPQTDPHKPCHQVVKGPEGIVGPPPVPLSLPPPPFDRFPLPPTAPPPRTSTLPTFITTPASAFPSHEPEPRRDPSRPRPQWYRAPQQPPQHHPRHSSLHKKVRDTCGMKRAAQRLQSQARTAGGSSSRFPLPLALACRLITPSRLLSPSSSAASSSTHHWVSSTHTPPPWELEHHMHLCSLHREERRSAECAGSLR